MLNFSKGLLIALIVTFFAGNVHALSDQDKKLDTSGNLRSSGLPSSGSTRKDYLDKESGGELQKGTSGVVMSPEESDAELYKRLQEKMMLEEQELPEGEGL